MNIQNTLETAKAALKELVAQTQGKFFAIKHDHFSMQDARSAIRKIDESLEYLEKQYPFGVYGTDDLNSAWKSGYDNCKAQRQWVGLTDEELAEFSEAKLGSYDLCLEVEDKLKEKNAS